MATLDLLACCHSFSEESQEESLWSPMPPTTMQENCIPHPAPLLSPYMPLSKRNTLFFVKNIHIYLHLYTVWISNIHFILNLCSFAPFFLIKFYWSREPIHCGVSYKTFHWGWFCSTFWVGWENRGNMVRGKSFFPSSLSLWCKYLFIKMNQSMEPHE